MLLLVAAAYIGSFGEVGSGRNESSSCSWANSQAVSFRFRHDSAEVRVRNEDQTAGRLDSTKPLDHVAQRMITGHFEYANVFRLAVDNHHSSLPSTAT
jgi:hypothetical protein